jgi:hypothetical protein
MASKEEAWRHIAVLSPAERLELAAEIVATSLTWQETGEGYLFWQLIHSKLREAASRIRLEKAAKANREGPTLKDLGLQRVADAVVRITPTETQPIRPGEDTD